MTKKYNWTLQLHLSDMKSRLVLENGNSDYNKVDAEKET